MKNADLPPALLLLTARPKAQTNNKSLTSAAMRTKRGKENVRIQEVQLHRELLQQGVHGEGRGRDARRPGICGAGKIDAGRLQYLYPTQYDVGVDNNDFTPVSYEQVKKKIERQIEQSKNEK